MLFSSCRSSSGRGNCFLLHSFFPCPNSGSCISTATVIFMYTSEEKVQRESEAVRRRRRRRERTRGRRRRNMYYVNAHRSCKVRAKAKNGICHHLPRDKRGKCNKSWGLSTSHYNVSVSLTLSINCRVVCSSEERNFHSLLSLMTGESESLVMAKHPEQSLCLSPFLFPSLPFSQGATCRA